MDDCKLCKANPADKKQSHMVPSFLLKRIENIEGKQDRDYEIGFTIQEFHTESHFGRSVQPEKLNEVYGEITEEDIEKNKHPLIVDNIFCTYCELRLSKIESEYAKTLTKFDESEYESGIPSELGLLFWLSIIWRMSINEKSGVQLTKFETETARRILDRCLNDNLSNIDIEAMKASKDLKKISYKLLRCPKFSETNVTCLIIHPKFDKPYILLIDEYLLLISFKNNYDDFLSKNLHGLKEEIFQVKPNKIGTSESISVLSTDYLKSLNSEIINTMKAIRMKWINNFLNALYVKMGGVGKIIPEQIRREIMAEVTSSEKKLGRKYTIADLKESTIKIMKNYGPLDSDQMPG